MISLSSVFSELVISLSCKIDPEFRLKNFVIGFCHCGISRGHIAFPAPCELESEKTH